MSREITIGLGQVTGRPYESEENRRHSLDAADELFSRGADVVVLPEMIVSGYGTDAEGLAGAAEPLDGPSTRAWTELAGRAGGLIVSGFCERDGDRLFNTAVVVGASGVLLHYRKLHLFSEEKHCFVPGDRGLPVVDTPFGVIGVCVCYDLRFVESARALTLLGAELICVPTAWLAGFDTERWDADGFCPQARGALLQANLDQAFIACASQAGPSEGYDFLGSSLVADPYGRAVLGPLPGSHEQLAIVTVDLDLVRGAHDRGALINPRKDRRTDVYGLSVEGVTH